MTQTSELVFCIIFATHVFGSTNILTDVSISKSFSMKLSLGFRVEKWELGTEVLKPCQVASSEAFCYKDESIPNQAKLAITEVSSKYKILQLKNIDGVIDTFNLVGGESKGKNVQIKQMKVTEEKLQTFLNVKEMNVLGVKGLNIPAITLPREDDCGNEGKTNCIKKNADSYLLLAENVDDAQTVLKCTRDGQDVSIGMRRYGFVNNFDSIKVGLNGKLRVESFVTHSDLTNCEISAVTDLPDINLNPFKDCKQDEVSRCFWYIGGGRSALQITSKGITDEKTMKLSGNTAKTFQITFKPIKCAANKESSLKLPLFILGMLTVKLL